MSTWEAWQVLAYLAVFAIVGGFTGAATFELVRSLRWRLANAAARADAVQSGTVTLQGSDQLKFTDGMAVQMSSGTGGGWAECPYGCSNGHCLACYPEFQPRKELLTIQGSEELHEEWRAGYCLCGEQLWCELPPWPSYACELSDEWPQPWSDRANDAGFAIGRWLTTMFAPAVDGWMALASRPSPMLRKLKAEADLASWLPERFTLSGRGTDERLTGPRVRGYRPTHWRHR